MLGGPDGRSRPHQRMTDNTEDEERGQYGEAQCTVDGLRRVGSRFRVDDDRARGIGECDHKHDLGWERRRIIAHLASAGTPPHGDGVSQAKPNSPSEGVFADAARAVLLEWRHPSDSGAGCTFPSSLPVYF
jgi:hypothetical protein